MIRVAHPTRAPIEMGEGAPLLEVRGLTVGYGGIVALKGIDLTVRPGEVVALVGSNGAGKTTTLRTIARLVEPTAGVVRFAGHDVAGLAPEQLVDRGVSLVPEGRAIFPNLTVRENLEMGAYLHRDRRVIAETTEDATRLFPRLGERMRQEAGTLSGGEQQMLAIGRALMARPSLLLLDEPSLGIAPLVVRGIFEAIAAIARAGVTVLVVEQNTRVALATSQRAYVLRTGEVALEGPSRELANDPLIQDAYLGG